MALNVWIWTEVDLKSFCCREWEIWMMFCRVCSVEVVVGAYLSWEERVKGGPYGRRSPPAVVILFCRHLHRHQIHLIKVMSTRHAGLAWSFVYGYVPVQGLKDHAMNLKIWNQWVTNSEQIWALQKNSEKVWRQICDDSLRYVICTKVVCKSINVRGKEWLLYCPD